MIRINGTLYVLAAAILWGTTGTTQALAPEDANSLTIGALRMIIGGAGLLVLALIQHRLCSKQPAFAMNVARVPYRWKPLPVLFGLGGVAIYQLCFFAAVARTGVAVGTIVGIGSAPVMTGILAVLILGERLTRRWMIATLLAICGCALLVLAGADIGVDLFGILLALGAGLAYAVYTLASKSLLEDHPPETVMAIFFFGAGLLLSPLLLTSDLSWLFTLNGMIVALHLGLLTTTLSYVLFARGLLTTPASTAVTLSLAEPLTAALLGVIVLHERLSLMAGMGILLLFFGLFFLTIRSAK